MLHFEPSDMHDKVFLKVNQPRKIKLTFFKKYRPLLIFDCLTSSIPWNIPSLTLQGNARDGWSLKDGERAVILTEDCRIVEGEDFAY